MSYDPYLAALDSNNDNILSREEIESLPPAARQSFERNYVLNEDNIWSRRSSGAPDSRPRDESESDSTSGADDSGRRDVDQTRREEARRQAEAQQRRDEARRQAEALRRRLEIAQAQLADRNRILEQHRARFAEQQRLNQLTENNRAVLEALRKEKEAAEKAVVELQQERDRVVAERDSAEQALASLQQKDQESRKEPMLNTAAIIAISAAAALVLIAIIVSVVASVSRSTSAKLVSAGAPSAAMAMPTSTQPSAVTLM